LDAKEKRQLETELLKMGLPGLQQSGAPTGELVQEIAGIVNMWPGHYNRHGEWIDKHKFLRDLLSECDESQRSDMYWSIVPHLTFKVRPLGHYESLIAERIGNLISKRAARVEGKAPHPIEIGLRKVLPAEATHVIAKLKCYKCKRAQEFVGDTPAGAMIAGRKAGWMRDMTVQKEVCPNCKSKIVN